MPASRSRVLRAAKIRGSDSLTQEDEKTYATKPGHSETVSVDYIVRQKKRFHFKEWQEEIGGDICVAHTVSLQGRSYTVFINADAMGKSIQGAGCPVLRKIGSQEGAGCPGRSRR